MIDGAHLGTEDQLDISRVSLKHGIGEVIVIFTSEDMKIRHSSPGCDLVRYLTSNCCEEVRC